MAPRHVGVGHAFGRRVAEVAPAVDHLLGRPARNAELQAAAGDEVGGAGVLRHVERVLVAHVDDRGADLDRLGARAAGGEQRERRAELAGEVMDAEIGAVGAERLGGDGKLDRLRQRVGGRPRLRLRRRGPMAEGEEADVFGASVFHGACVTRLALSFTLPRSCRAAPLGLYSFNASSPLSLPTDDRAAARAAGRPRHRGGTAAAPSSPTTLPPSPGRGRAVRAGRTATPRSPRCAG